MDFLDDFIGLKKTDIDGDEAGEGEAPPQSSLKTNEDGAYTEVSENTVSAYDLAKIIVTPPESFVASVMGEVRDELAEPLEGAAVHAATAVMPDPLAFLVEALEVASQVQDAASAAPAPEVRVIPGEQEQSAGDKKKRRLKKKIEIESMEQQP